MEIKLGEVEDYFAHVGAISVTLESPLAVGDTIKIHKHDGDIIQKVESLQIEHVAVTSAKEGARVGIKVKEKVHAGNKIFKVVE